MARSKIARLACVAAFSAACITLSAASASAAGDAAKGEKLAAQHCNSCHSVGRSDSARMADAGPQFAELAKKSSQYLETAINKPHDFMPKFPTLSKGDKDDLIAYIRTVK